MRFLRQEAAMRSEFTSAVISFPLFLPVRTFVVDEERESREQLRFLVERTDDILRRACRRVLQERLGQTNVTHARDIALLSELRGGSQTAHDRLVIQFGAPPAGRPRKRGEQAST